MRFRVATAHKKLFRRAVLLSLITSILSGALYSEIRKKEDTSLPILPSIPLGEQFFTIVAKDSCVGSVDSSLKYDGSYLLKTNLELRVVARGQKRIASVHFEAEFNSLGQLGGSIADLDFDGTGFRLGTKEVNPVEIVARYKDKNGGDRKIERTIPGPIEIFSEGRGEYRIRYRYLPVKQISLQSSELPKAFEDLNLSVKPREEVQCDANAHLSLDSLLESVERLANRYRLLMGLLNK